MTKKIIIDGVDVAKCGYRINKECMIKGLGVSGSDTFYRECSDNSTCYYKQLQRTKLELEKYIKDKFCQDGCAIYQFDKIKELTQENEELKAEIKSAKQALEEINSMFDAMDIKGRGFYTKDEFIEDFVLIINKVKTTLDKEKIKKFIEY